MRKSLLILGFGGHGKVVYEIAKSVVSNGNIYENIDFLDDNEAEAIGKINELEKYKGIYDEVFCGIGNNQTRRKILKQAEKLGFEIATLIHPTAYVSPTAIIKKGTIIEPKAVVNARSLINEGCIVSIGAIVDHDVVVEEYAHLNSGAICKAGSRISELKKIEAGEVVE